MSTETQGRSQRMTEKGAEYKLDTSQTEYRRLRRKLKRDGDALLQKIEEGETGEQLQQSVQQWNSQLQALQDKHQEIQSLLEGEELANQNKSHAEVLQDLAKTELLLEKVTPQQQAKDKAPSIAGESRRSYASSKGSSVASKLSLLRLEHKQKQAELIAKQRLLEEQRKLEQRKRDLEWEEQQFQLKMEYTINQEKMEVLENFDKEDDVGTQTVGATNDSCTNPENQRQERTNSKEKEVTFRTQKGGDKKMETVKTDHGEPVGASGANWSGEVKKTRDESDRQQCKINEDSDSNGNALHRLADLLTIRDKHSLPTLEPEVFTGDVCVFHAWLKSFESYIEQRTSSPIERLHFLGRYTSGEAKAIIQGLLSLRSPEAYMTAKEKLVERYGNEFLLAKAYREKIKDWPTVKPGDGKALQKLADYLENCDTAMKTVPSLANLNDPLENAKIVAKLPRYISDRWKRNVDEWLYEGSRQGYPPFEEFVKFIRKEARVACSPIDLFSDRDRQSHDKGGQEKRQSATKSARTFTSSTAAPNKTCVLCQQPHNLEECSAFKAMTLTDRHATMKKHRLCWGCFKRGHVRRDCIRKKKCDICNKYHPTLLHDFSYIPPSPTRSAAPQAQPTPSGPVTSQPGVASATSMTASASSGRQSLEPRPCSHSMIVPVFVFNKSKPSERMLTYALLDPQSDTSYVLDGVAESLGASGVPVTLEINTITGTSTTSSTIIRDLAIVSYDNSTVIELPPCFSRNAIPTERSLIPRRETAAEWDHLSPLQDKIPPYFPDAEVGLLLGTNCPRAVKPRDIISTEGDEPWAVRTSLGWGIVGKSRSLGHEHDNCWMITSRALGQKMSYCFKSHAKVIAPSQVEVILERIFQADEGAPKASQEDLKFQEVMQKSFHIREDGHAELPLPLKDPSATVPDNLTMAEERLKGLNRRLIKHSQYREHYIRAMEELISKGYAELVPEDEEEPGHIWYIPHHGVFHPKKPNKLRVVFDCSATFEGKSLNHMLMQGPDLTNGLVGILCRFRKHAVAVTCDIEGMFLQVGVSREHRDMLRFLWWEHGDLHLPPKRYRMNVHLFGATSSPACAMFTLRSVADIYAEEATDEAVSFIKNDFYIDDGITSTKTAAEAISLVENTAKLCNKVSFKLHKFASNDKEVLKSIPAASRATGLQELDLSKDKLPVERTLGIQWDTEADVFRFDANVPERQATRRGLLSAVSSIFDPLGLVSPVTVNAKKILKELCQAGLEWDQPISDAKEAEWNEWKEDLKKLEALQVPRCVSAGLTTDIKTAELHYFSDGSLSAYGQCSYLKLVDDNGNVSTNLIMSKANVTPSKPVTVPRLELTAALLSVRTSLVLKRELKIEGVSEHFWTDSRVVLGYVSNEAKRFHIFVANRVKEIREHTTPEQWKFVETKENPADIASRGMEAGKLVNNESWWKGPDFLRSPKPTGTVECEDRDLDPEDKEIKRSKDKTEAMTTHTTQTKTTTEEFASLPKRLERFSKWETAKKAVANCLKYKRILRQRHAAGELQSSVYRSLTVADVKEAEDTILKVAQEEAFSEEMSNIQGGSAVKRSSSLRKLDPVMQDGLLCVGGRLRRSSLPAPVKHPVIIPKDTHVAKLIVDHYHRKTHHSGRGMTLSAVRAAGYWIVGARSKVSSHILQCVICKRLRGTAQQQKMADLPPDRMLEVAPFTYSAVDAFGPFYIKDKRSQVKRWGLLFTCLSSRAVHIETINTLTTDSFISAFRRFICRRGKVRELRCDRGTNFVGGRSVLEEGDMDQQKIQQELLQHDCDYVTFNLNVPLASHMGGVWERMIRSARNVLTALITAHSDQLDDELLRTFMAEAECIVNCRPLTPVESTSLDFSPPLSPNQILTLKSDVVLPPPGEFGRADLYCRKRWRRVQHLANEFWSRWRADFLPTLQERRKWTSPKENLKVNDMVLVIDEDTPRSRWPLGRVASVRPGSDGLIRSVSVTVGGSERERPVHKVIRLFSTE